MSGKQKKGLQRVEQRYGTQVALRSVASTD
jgi:hypothetical protein